MPHHTHRTRLPAEWEPQAATLLTWPHQNTDWNKNIGDADTVYTTLSNTISQHQPLIIVTTDDNHRQHIETLLHLSTQATSIQTYPISFYNCPSNDTWTRDYGPISVIQHKQLTLLDFEFNGWGNKYPSTLDTKITSRLVEQHAFQALPTIQNTVAKCISLDFVLEGGSIETDGQGTLLTTRHCLLSSTRNPSLNCQQIETFLSDAFGLRRIIWLDHGKLEGDDTDGHIDTLARFISPTQILYQACSDTEDSHFVEFDRMKQQLLDMKQTNGETYQIIELPWPDACHNTEGQRLPATYANFLFINDAVLVPLYDVEQDQKVIALFNNLFSGSFRGIQKRKVIGINCRSLIEQFGSLHCITMNIMKP